MTCKNQEPLSLLADGCKKNNALYDGLTPFTTVVAAGLGLPAIADAVELIFELLAGHWGAIRPMLLAGGDLAKRIVAEIPMEIVGTQDDVGALVGGVIAVGEVGQSLDTRATLRNRR